MTNIWIAEGYFADLEVKWTAKFNSQTYFFLLNHISATKSLWNYFLAIIIHVDAYYKGYHKSFVTMAPTLDFQDGQSWYVWRKKPSVPAIFVTFFLADIPHFNHSIALRLYSIWNEEMLLGTMTSTLDFPNGYLLWLSLQIEYGTTGSFCIFLWIKYSDGSIIIEFISKGVKK